MDRLFEIRPVSKANKIVLQEVQERDREFRHDAEGADLSASKGKLEHFETAEEV